MKDKGNKYTVPANCHVCSKKFMARYNVGDRAKVCTPPSHKCKRKTIYIPGHKDRLVVCIEKCCRSKYYKGAASAATSASLDSRKFLNDSEYTKTISETKKLPNPFGIGVRFTLEVGCRLGETLLVRKRHVEFKEGPLSIVRIPTLKNTGHPLLPVHIDNKGKFIVELREFVKNLKPNDFLFSVARRTFQRTFERLLDKVKPDRSSLVHILRHTRASRLVASGLDPNTIRQEMRWKSIELLKVYSHTTEGEVATAFKKIR
jgi:integrase